MVCALKYILVGNYLFLDQYFNAPHFFCSSFFQEKVEGLDPHTPKCFLGEEEQGEALR
jgi:hypothetical protein